MLSITMHEKQLKDCRQSLSQSFSLSVSRSLTNFFGHRKREWQPTALDYMSGQFDLQQMDTVDSFR